jgi:hypothetical protein
MEAGRHGTINCGEARWRHASGRPARGRGWVPLGSDVRGNAVDGLRKLEEEAPFGKYSKVAQVEWVERAHGGLWAKQLGLLGAGPVGPESEEK